MSDTERNNEDLGWKPQYSKADLKSEKPLSDNQKIPEPSISKTEKSSTNTSKSSEPSIEKDLKEINWRRILKAVLVSLVLTYLLEYVLGDGIHGIGSFLTIFFFLIFMYMLIQILQPIITKLSTLKKSFTVSTTNEHVLLKGVVTGFTQGTEMSFNNRQKTTWNFRIECFEDGKLINTIPVKMSGSKFLGAINNGDEVEVHKWKKGKLLQTNKIKNLTSGIEVTTNDQTMWLGFLIAIVVFVIIVVMARIIAHNN